MIERYQDNLKGKIIEYQGRKLCVVDQVYYKGEHYAYVFNIEKYEESQDLEINFLRKVSDGTLEVVTDMDLFDKLLQSVGSNMIADQIKKLDFNVNE